MTDTTETIVTPDPHAIARAVLLEVADESDQVGDFVTSYDPVSYTHLTLPTICSV